MPKFYNEITHEIVEYPAKAAAQFPVLKPVPSEKAKAAEVEKSEEAAPTADIKPIKKNGDADAK